MQLKHPFVICLIAQEIGVLRLGRVDVNAFGIRIPFGVVLVNEESNSIIVDVCPFCHLQMDLGQMEANGIYKDMIGEPFKIPVIYLTQLLGLAFGIDPNRLGLVKNHNLAGVPPFISIDPFMEKAKEQLT